MPTQFRKRRARVIFDLCTAKLSPLGRSECGQCHTRDSQCCTLSIPRCPLRCYGYTYARCPRTFEPLRDASFCKGSRHILDFSNAATCNRKTLIMNASMNDPSLCVSVTANDGGAVIKTSRWKDHSSASRVSFSSAFISIKTLKGKVPRLVFTITAIKIRISDMERKRHFTEHVGVCFISYFFPKLFNFICFD